MSDIAITVENLSKRYQLGEVGAGSIRDGVERWLHRIRGRDPRAEMGRVGGAASRLSSNDEPITTHELWALKDVSFEVRRGEVLGLIGRNGAGKSTLLKILTRITEPTSGRAIMRGRVASLLEVGTGFHPELTGRDNVYLSGAILGMKKREISAKFDDIVAFAEVEKFIDTPVKRYSSGMYVRLAFAVAAHLDPEMLLVDEVLAVGDAAFQKKCLGKMGDVAGQGRTVLFVSHNMYAMESLCRRGLFLGKGRVLRDGAIHDVIGDYLGLSSESLGEVRWENPGLAPGDGRVKLEAVRVVSNGTATGQIDMTQPFQIEVDYRNIEPDSRRILSVHLHNSMGVFVLSSGNMACATLSLDPWSERRYPSGLFRTTCRIPGGILNDGRYSITIYINEMKTYDTIILARDVLSFSLEDTGKMDREFSGEWLGVIRPRLDWMTQQLE